MMTLDEFLESTEWGLVKAELVSQLVLAVDNALDSPDAYTKAYSSGYAKAIRDALEAPKQVLKNPEQDQEILPTEKETVGEILLAERKISGYY